MIYIASPFFNQEQLDFVKAIESALNRKRIDYFSPRSTGVLLDMTEEEKQKRKKEIYNDNVKNIDMCTLMIAVIDDKDVGTMWEMGYATAKGKPIISISNKNYGLNVMLAESVRAHVLDIPQMFAAIYDPYYSGEIIRGVY